MGIERRITKDGEPRQAIECSHVHIALFSFALSLTLSLSSLSFARKAAFMIHQLFDSTSVSERSKMIKRSSITPIQLLSATSRQRIEEQMRLKFLEFDSDNDGILNEKEFHNCLADTNLILSTQEIQHLRQRASNEEGRIDLQAFMKFAYETLLHLQRDAALKNHMTNVLNHQKQHHQHISTDANRETQ